MMRTYLFSQSMVSALSLLAVSCTGTETGNPPFTAELGFTAHSTDPSVVGVDVPSPTGVRLDQSWLVLERMQFVPVEGPPPEGQVEGLGAADHAGDEPTQVDFTLEEGDYQSFQVPFGLGTPGGPAEAPAELVGASIVLIGTLANGTEVRVAIQVAPNVTVQAPSQFAMDPDAGAVLLGFDAATWLQNVDFTALTVREGVIYVSQTENSAAHDQIRDNIGAGLTLFRDANGDARIDPAETVLATGA